MKLKVGRKIIIGGIYLVFICAFMACSSSKKGAGLGLGEDGEFSDSDLSLSQRRWGDGNIPLASSKTEGLFQDIFFNYDSAMVEELHHDLIKENAKALAADSTLRVEVEGHCDKRGTNEYNLALGGERARNIAELLVSYGASSKQVSTISYGEEVPVDSADQEDAYAKNRRVHFAVIKDGV